MTPICGSKRPVAATTRRDCQFILALTAYGSLSSESKRVPKVARMLQLFTVQHIASARSGQTRQGFDLPSLIYLMALAFRARSATSAAS